jgi:hypothetical protein
LVFNARASKYARMNEHSKIIAYRAPADLVAFAEEAAAREGHHGFRCCATCTASRARARAVAGRGAGGMTEPATSPSSPSPAPASRPASPASPPASPASAAPPGPAAPSPTPAPTGGDPTEVQIRIPESIAARVPAGMQVTLDENDPRLPALRSIVADHGLSQDVVDAIVALDAQQRSTRLPRRKLISPREEKARRQRRRAADGRQQLGEVARSQRRGARRGPPDRDQRGWRHAA